MIETKTHQKAVLTNWYKSLDFTKLMTKYGAPVWVISRNQLVANLKAFTHFTGAVERILYPIKANPSLPVLQALAQQGAGADCANEHEVTLALLSGFSYASLSYNSPYQDVNLCSRLLQNGATVVLDDPAAIVALEEKMQHTPFCGKIILRINLLSEADYSIETDVQSLMSHGHHSSKFGIPAEELAGLLTELKLPISGLHAHIGTQMDNMKGFIQAIQELTALGEQCFELGHPITDINIGGGLGIPFAEHDNFPSLETWVNELVPYKNKSFNYYVEPGHALVGNAVGLLTQILTIKTSRQKKWVIMDVGTDQLAKITLLKWPHRILTDEGLPLQKGNDAIAGPLCFSGDTLLEGIDASALTQGKPLFITEVGAYTFAMSNKFNGRLSPAWVVLDEHNQDQLVVQKESLYDHSQYSQYNWALDTVSNNQPFNSSEELTADQLFQLSSDFLKEGIKLDTYEFSRCIRTANNSYTFEVDTHSSAGFISMPFMIRIFGDAGIVAWLYKLGYSSKEQPVWGRKVTLECYEPISSDEPFIFTVKLSETIEGKNKKAIITIASICEKSKATFVAVTL